MARWLYEVTEGDYMQAPRPAKDLGPTYWELVSVVPNTVNSEGAYRFYWKRPARKGE